MGGNTNFNGDLSKWDISRVTYMRGMFGNTDFDGDLSKWDVSKVTDMYLMFENSTFNGDLSKWDVAKVTDMKMMFHGAPCSLCGHVPHRFEAPCRNECAMPGDLAPNLSFVLV